MNVHRLDSKQQAIVSHYQKTLRNTLGETPKYWLAGGSLTRVLSDEAGPTIGYDLDIFCSSRLDADLLISRLESNDHWTIVRKTFNAVKYTNGLCDFIDIVFEPFPNPSAVVESFDFTACQVFLSDLHDPRTVMVKDHTVEECLSKSLEFVSGWEHRTKTPAKGFYRVLKYVRRGWTLRKDSGFRLLNAIRQGEDSLVEASELDYLLGTSAER